MATTKFDPHLRWEITLNGPETLDDDLGAIGEHVGPRKGADKRTHGEMEDFVLRYLLVALRQCGSLAFPVVISAETERKGRPDFVLDESVGGAFGVEVTQAGEAIHQKWLTKTEAAADSGDAVLISDDGYVPGVEIDNVASEFAKNIRKKLSAYHQKEKYHRPSDCDLAVYDNTKWGWDLDPALVVQRLQNMNDLRGGFRAVHLVFGPTVVLDALGDNTRMVDVSHRYEIDFTEWLFDQAKRLKRDDLDNLDTEYLAEELESLGRSQKRALRSHMRNRLAHMIKWDHQPEKRSRSWYASLRNSLTGMEDQIALSPSLGTGEFLAQSLSDVFPQAKRQALQETGLPSTVVGDECPYSLEQIFDESFAGVEPEED